LKDTVKV
jgi:chromosome segregation ATPase